MELPQSTRSAAVGFWGFEDREHPANNIRTSKAE